MSVYTPVKHRPEWYWKEIFERRQIELPGHSGYEDPRSVALKRQWREGKFWCQRHVSRKCLPNFGVSAIRGLLLWACQLGSNESDSWFQNVSICFNYFEFSIPTTGTDFPPTSGYTVLYTVYSNPKKDKSCSWLLIYLWNLLTSILFWGVEAPHGFSAGDLVGFTLRAGPRWKPGMPGEWGPPLGPLPRWLWGDRGRFHLSPTKKAKGYRKESKILLKKCDEWIVDRFLGWLDSKPWLRKLSYRFFWLKAPIYTVYLHGFNVRI